MSRIALCAIATGKKYHKYAEPLIESAAKFFPPHEFILFSDREPQLLKTDQHLQQIPWPEMGFPRATLYRHRIYMDWMTNFSRFDYIFNIDIDMLMVAPIKEEEICAQGLTATLHPGFIGRRGSPETRSESRAYLPNADRYFCGGFSGGSYKEFLTMALNVSLDIIEDDRHGIRAIWNDESHLNRYLFDHPPALVLSPSFCYPEDYAGQYGWAPGTYEPKILCLDKRKER